MTRTIIIFIIDSKTNILAIGVNIIMSQSLIQAQSAPSWTELLFQGTISQLLQ